MSNAAMQTLELQNWNMNNFELPSAVTTEPLDPSEPIDIEFFNDWANDMALPNSSTTNCKSIVIKVRCFADALASPAMSPILASIPAPQLNLPTSQLRSSTASAFDMSDSVGSGIDQFWHDLGMMSQPMQPKAMISSPSFPISIPQAAQQPASEDWSIYLESVPPTTQPVPVISAPQPYEFIDFSNIPDFDLSMLKPSPPSPADIIAQSEVATKRAKLEQWRAHLEAAKKLEEELTTS